MIPGQYFFKYVTLGGSNDGREGKESDALGRKRLRETCEANVSERNSKVSPFGFIKFVIDNC